MQWSYEKIEMMVSYGIPITHDPDQSRVWNSSKTLQEVPQSDLCGCSQVNIQLCEEW